MYVHKSTRRLRPAAFTAVLLVCTTVLVRADGAGGNPRVLPPNSDAYGKTYAEWSAAWWRWFMQFPLDGNPGTNSFTDVTAGQSGNVWFLAAPFGTTDRTVTIPAGKAIFVGLLNAEMSSLEGDATEAQQRADAEALADHIVGVSCTIDGKAVKNLDDYRVQSPQFSFTAPTPWIFGDTGGAGTSVADGYYLLLAPLPAGRHTIEWSGDIHFSFEEDGFDADFPLDMTYTINVR
jgi:hypothetical protein